MMRTNFLLVPQIMITKHAQHLATTTQILPRNISEYHSLLSSCRSLKSLLQIHCRLIISGIVQDHSTISRLINSYISFQRCDFARSVFGSLPNPSVVQWNPMIRAYTRSNQHKEALNMYQCMLGNGLEPDKYTFTFVLRACTGALDLQEGVLVHREVARKRLECDVFIGTGLIDMYCKLGELQHARELFVKMPAKDVVTWNAMIAGLAQSSHPVEALEFFHSMQLHGLRPNSVSLLNLFPAVSRLGDLYICRSIHAHVIRRNLSVPISNGLIDMYSKCGDVEVARIFFDRMWGRDDVSWGTMMAGYAYNGCFHEVLELFDGMTKQNDVRINKVSIISALTAAGETRDLSKGKEIHDCAVKQGLHLDVVVATSLFSMYAKCGELEKANQLFKGLPERDIIAWSAIIGAFVQAGCSEEAFSLLWDMQNDKLKPNMVTLTNVLSACADLSALRSGKSIHCYAVKAGFDSDISIGTTLLSMYAKCGFFTYAQTIFNRVPCKDVVIWNALINGYSQTGDPHNAMKIFHKLQLSNTNPDSGTMTGPVTACVLLNDLDQGSCIHGQIIKRGFEFDSHINNAVIDMYAKCGSLHSAEFLFAKAEVMKDEISWNVMIAGYMRNGCAREAISTFIQMRLENLQPNLVTHISVIPAVAYLASLKEGMAMHANIIKTGFLSSTLIGNSLIDMYSKCGWLHYAEKCFYEVENKSTVSWNAMLSGYALHGFGDLAISFFSLMQKSDVHVDSVSFVSVLSACRHVGLVEQGRKIFKSMREMHNVEPDLEHYACMVDLLGRAGLFDEILALIGAMPMEPDAGVWGALLGACGMHSNLMLGEVALDHLVKLEPKNVANYVVLSGLYAQCGKWDDAGTARSNTNVTGLKKIPGCSWVEGKKPRSTLSK